MFPTQHHAKLVFSAFDIHNTNSLNASQLRHALVSVGLGDAPKQVVYGIIRQSRSEAQQHASDENVAPQQQPSSVASSWAPSAAVSPHPGTSMLSSMALKVGGVDAAFGVGAAPSFGAPHEYETKPITTVVLSEFLLVVKELAPSSGSNEELWKGFKCMDTQQQGRITLETMIDVTRREEEKMVGKLCLDVQDEEALRQSPIHRHSHSACARAASPAHLSTIWRGARLSDEDGTSSSARQHRTAPRSATLLAADESCLRRIVDRVAEYREKGISFDEWRLACAPN